MTIRFGASSWKLRYGEKENMENGWEHRFGAAWEGLSEEDAEWRTSDGSEASGRIHQSGRTQHLPDLILTGFVARNQTAQTAFFRFGRGGAKTCDTHAAMQDLKK